mgnify:CR=1 FL=1
MLEDTDEVTQRVTRDRYRGHFDELKPMLECKK